MLFNSAAYLLFLPLVVALYWRLPKNWRPVLLLIASYFFYMSWLPIYGILIASLSAANYACGLFIDKWRGSRWRQLVFCLGLVINLGCLAFFKYANFLCDGATALARGLAHSALIAPHWNIILPLGISFFVFEFIHYLADVYKGVAPIRSPIRFALFAAFFPSQIAGPIKRFEDFDGQVLARHDFSPHSFNCGVLLILEGMFKKVVLGDNLALLVQAGFGAAHTLAPFDAWLTVIAFAWQIYYDFSGYTDIGRGSALLFNIHLPENFNKPYLASSLIDFWRRWHMSLSTWLRDYLYKPLGGSRGGIVLQNRNLLITMLLGGLWHGAAWHFVAWGALHGVGLTVNHAWRRFAVRFEQHGLSKLMLPFGGYVLTIFAVLVGWVLFRADNFTQAVTMYAHMFFYFQPSRQPGFLFSSFLASPLPAAATFYILLLGGARYLHKRFAPNGLAPVTDECDWRWWFYPSVAARSVCYAGMALLILSLASKKAAPFIYFQF